MDKHFPEETLYGGYFPLPKDFVETTLFGHDMRGAENGVAMGPLAVVLQIFVGFDAAISAKFPAAGNMVVVMELMDDGGEPGQIHDGKSVFAGVLDAPLIEPDAANGEWRDVAVGAASKDEKIYSGVAFELAFRFSAGGEFFLPAFGEIQRLADFQIGAAANGEEAREFLADFFDAGGELAGKNDVGVDVGNEVAGSVLLSTGQNAGKKRRAMAIAEDVGDVDEAELAGSFGGALFSAEEDDFGAGEEFGPTGDGVALDHGDVAEEGLCHGADG